MHIEKASLSGQANWKTVSPLQGHRPTGSDFHPTPPFGWPPLCNANMAPPAWHPCSSYVAAPCLNSSGCVGPHSLFTPGPFNQLFTYTLCHVSGSSSSMSFSHWATPVYLMCHWVFGLVGWHYHSQESFPKSSISICPMNECIALPSNPSVSLTWPFLSLLQFAQKVVHSGRLASIQIHAEEVAQLSILLGNLLSYLKWPLLLSATDVLAKPSPSLSYLLPYQNHLT